MRRDHITVLGAPADQWRRLATAAVMIIQASSFGDRQMDEDGYDVEGFHRCTRDEWLRDELPIRISLSHRRFPATAIDVQASGCM